MFAPLQAEFGDCVKIILQISPPAHPPVGKGNSWWQRAGRASSVAPFCKSWRSSRQVNEMMKHLAMRDGPNDSGAERGKDLLKRWTVPKGSGFSFRPLSRIPHHSSSITHDPLALRLASSSFVDFKDDVLSL